MKQQEETGCFNLLRRSGNSFVKSVGVEGDDDGLQLQDGRGESGSAGADDAPCCNGHLLSDLSNLRQGAVLEVPDVDGPLAITKPHLDILKINSLKTFLPVYATLRLLESFCQVTYFVMVTA